MPNETPKPDPVVHPHDNAFTSAMTDLRVARDFLQHYLPNTVLKQIDLSTLKLHPTTFIDPELRRIMSDMLYSVNFVGQKKQAFLYLAVDHQSTPDKLMPFRMIKYTCRIIDYYSSEDKTKPLPIVIPIIVYNGKSKYPYSCSIFDCFGEHKALAERFMFNQFELTDLSQVPDEEIRQHQWSGLLEMLFKHAAARDITNYLEQLSHIVDHLVIANADNYLLTMIKYAIEESEIKDRSAFYHWVHTHLSPPLEGKAMTLAEQLRQEGRQEGRREGRQEGKLQGEQSLLMRQLHRRFPNLKRDHEIRIKNARTEELLLWGERILDSKNIDEVFEG